MARSVDLYTKIVLTVIAVALCVIAFRPLLTPTPAEAQYGATDVNLVSIAGVRFSPIRISPGDAVLPVKITNDQLPIEYPRTGLPVNVKNWPPGLMIPPGH